MTMHPTFHTTMASHIHTHHYPRPPAQSQAPPPPSSVALFNQETLMQRLRALIEGVRESWTYAIFWQWSYDISGAVILGWGEGFYKDERDNGKVKPKSTTYLVEQEYRKKILLDLKSLICYSDTSADDAIVDQEVTDTEWFFLVSMTQNFVNGGGLPGQAFFQSNPIWVAGPDRLATSSCQRALQGQEFGLETMVCVPTANGVVELGSTELIFQSSDLMNKVRVLFDFSNLEAAEPIACSNVDSKFTTDYTSKFTTNEKFKSREDLIEWACKVGKSNGFGIVTLRSDNGGKGNKRPRFTLGCKKSGKYDSRRPKKEIKNKDRRHSRTKKCDCPFQLKGKKLATYWELTVVKGMHNHPVDYSEVGHSFLGGLSSSKEKHDDVRPMEKLNRLRKDNEGHETTTSQCLREVESGRSEMQPLLSKLSEYNYIEQHRTCPKTDAILDFFLTHATSLDLLRTFPNVLIVHCTMKSKGIYEGAVLEIYGLTSTDIQFFVGLVFLSSKQKDSYEWACRTLHGLMVGNGIAKPDVIVVGEGIDGIIVATAQEVVDLMEGIDDVFVTSKILLRTLLISILVKQNCQMVFESKDELGSFLKKWDILVSSSTTLELERQLLQVCNDFSRYPDALEYVTKTWLEPYKEKFVQAWTNTSMHFGIAKGISSYDTKFRDLIADFICSINLPVKKQILHLEMSFEEIHAGLELQNTLIKASFESSLTVVGRNEFWYHELNDLRGFVSIKALNLVEQQITSAVDGDICSCTIQLTHGLPCSHEIAKYMRDCRPIPLECIHPHWRKLDMEHLGETAESYSVNERMKRRRLSKNMNTSAHSVVPSSEIIVESAQRNSTTCGPPIFHSKQGWQLEEKVYCIPLKFLGVCPIVMRPYILYIEDVASDGHCGFRAIASLLGKNNDDGWIRVRSDLMKELEFNSAQYTQLFMSKKRVDELHHALAYSDSGTTCLVQKEHWMTMPDMGHVIASCYNVVLMLFSSAQCLTFFPLRTVPLSLSSPKEIVIGFVNEHFVQVFLKQGHPMPLIAEDWKRYNEHKQSFIEEWTTPYNARIKDFTDLQPDIYLDKSLISVDT